MSFADIWDSLGSTVKSIGKATPLATMGGLVYDLAHSTYDGEDQTFGDYLNMLGKRVGQMADPLLNPETLTGKAVTGVGHGLETAYREGVSEPIVTWDTVMQHATSKGGQFSEIFHSDSWARAYKVAQDRSMGQSAVVGNSALMGGEDPLDPGAYQDIHRRHGWKATGVSGTYDFLANWFLDPTVVGGKAAKGVKAAAYLRKITKADHQAGIGNLMETEDYRKVFGVNLGNISRSAGLKTRTEAVIGTHESTGFVDGKNAAQIRAGMPELARSTQGSQIASLLADTNKLTSSADKINARQRILRVAYGDEVAIGDLKGELAHIDDQLNNMQQESVVGLERAEAEDSVFSFTRGRKFDSPDVLADAERQVANQEGAVKLLQSSADDLNSILDVQGAARTATLRESAAGRRGLARAEGRGLLRSGEVNTGYERYDALANRGMDLAKRFGQIGAIETLYQHSLAGMPLRIIKKLHVDMPVAASDALRTSRLQGIVNLHDVDGTGRQLDSMMFRAKLAPNDRMSLQSEYMGARTEAERMSIIAKVENASVRSMAKRHTGQDLDTQKAVDAFIGELANRGSMRRDSMASALNGRAYAATKLDRAVQSMGQDGAANWREMRVDQIDDDGIPVSLPILETQGANLLPLMDVDHAERTLRRQGSRLSKLAKAWQSERFEFDKLSRQKAAGGLILDDVLEARRKMADHVAEVGDELTRIWKFGVLMRLGYPLRILADDHMRIWAKIGAGAMYHPMWQEGVRKFGYNAMRRRTDLKARRIGLQGRIRTLNDLIGDEDNVKRFQDTTAEIKALDKQIAKSNVGEAQPFDPNLTREAENARRANYQGRLPTQAEIDDAEAWGSDIDPTRRIGKPIPQMKEPEPEALPGSSRIANRIHQISVNQLSDGGQKLDLTHGLRGEELAEAKKVQAALKRWLTGEQNFDKATGGRGMDPELLKAIEGAPTIKAALYRGGHDRKLKVGDEFEDSPTSYSTDRATGELFAHNASGENALYSVRGDKRALHIKGVQEGQLNLEEALVGGKFRVASIERFDNPHGGTLPHYILEQLPSEAVERAKEFTARRNALEQMRGDDVNELIAERDELQALFDDKAWQGELPEHIAKKAGVERAGIDKRRMGEGQIQIAGGHTLDDAFAGEYGHAARKMISSDETFEMNLLDSEAKTYASSSAGNWRTIMPDEPEHGAAWEWAINKQLRQSQVAMRFIRGESVEDVTKWLKTAEGRALRKRIPWHTHDPEAYAHRVKAMVDEYVPEGSIREAAVRRNVRKGDLQAHIGDDLNRAPAVHGGQVDVNLGGLGGISGVINGAMSRMYRYISEVPTDALSRHPFFMAMYRQEARDLGAIRVAAAKREGKELSTADLNEITKLARDRARHELKRTLFDMSAHSNAAATMRWVSPFFSAHQEGLQRWWRLASDDPSVVRRFTQAFNGPREMGLVIDENGNPVKPGDPISGDHRILVPKPIARMMGFGDDQPITVNENSFNLVLQGGLTNPGFGPMVALPVEYAAQHLPDQQAIVRLARAMNPVRPGDPSDVVMPATIRRVMAAVQGEKNGEFAYYYTRNIQDSVVQFQLDKHRMPNRAEFARIEKAAKDQTTAVAWLRVGQNSLSGAPATPDSRFAVQRNAWHRLMDESRINGKGFEWAEKVFIDKYGPAFFPLIQSTSNNPAGMDATGQTVAAIKRHRGLLDLLPAKLHTMVVGPESAGAYSGEAAAWLRNNQIKPGDPATYYSNEAPGEAGLSGLVSKGWSDYNKAMSGLNAQAFSMGLASYRDSADLTAMKGQIVDALSKRNFAWWDDYNDYNPEEFETLISGMNTIANDKRLNRDNARGDVQVLKQYLNLRSGFKQMLSLQKLQGGSDSPDAVSNAGLMQQYSMAVSQLVESNTFFEQNMYNGLIERDPLLVDIAPTAAPTGGLLAA